MGYLVDGRKNDYWRSSYQSDYVEQRRSTSVLAKPRPQGGSVWPPLCQPSKASSVVTATATSILAAAAALPGGACTVPSCLSAVEPSVVSGIAPVSLLQAASRRS